MNEDAANARRVLDGARRSLADALADVDVIERACRHKWCAPVRRSAKLHDGYTKKDLMGHFTTNEDGTINAPDVWIEAEYKTWWERTCDKCGMVQEAERVEKQVTSLDVPVFGKGGR